MNTTKIEFSNLYEYEKRVLATLFHFQIQEFGNHYIGNSFGFFVPEYENDYPKFIAAVKALFLKRMVLIWGLPRPLVGLNEQGFEFCNSNKDRLKDLPLITSNFKNYDDFEKYVAQSPSLRS